MRWVDVIGPPGVGKSELCDAAWPPRGIPDDGQAPPLAWSTFIAVADQLLARVANHPSASACRSMWHRSLRKMATVARFPGDATYIQTGLAQRGLGFGWRLDNPNDVAAYYLEMPVSKGVVFLTAPVDVIQARNVARGKDRSFMVPHMVRPLEVAREVLARRRVRVLDIDTTKPIDDCRRALLEFAQ